MRHPLRAGDATIARGLEELAANCKAQWVVVQRLKQLDPGLAELTG